MYEEFINKKWHEDTEQREALRDKGAEAFFNSFVEFPKAFKDAPDARPVMCIDEGCTGYGVHLAGSGSGIPEDTLIAELKAARITEFTTHEGCGKWALDNPQITDPKELDTTVQEWGRGIAEKLGLPYRHILLEQMDRPKEFHSAFYALYDGTGLFNRAAAKLPAGFTATPKFFGSAKEDLVLAAKIAFGAHGFGNRFTAENPFVLIGVVDPHSTDPKLSSEQLKKDLEEVQGMFDLGRIKNEIITAPI